MGSMLLTIPTIAILLNGAASAQMFRELSTDVVQTVEVGRADGDGAIYRIVPEAGLQTVVAETASNPGTFALDAAYPNPFNSGGVIPYRVARDGDTQLTVYNVAGQVVRHLVSAHQVAGYYEVAWDGRDDHGHTLATGVYLYRLRSSGRAAADKLLLV